MSISREGGFTIVEILVAVVVAVLFIGMFLQGYSFALATLEAQQRNITATFVANANLLKYRFKKSMPQFNCILHTKPENGLVLLSDSSSNREQIPPGNYGGYFSQKVVAYTRHREDIVNDKNLSADCDGIITVESTVVYGPSVNRIKVTQLRYAKE